MARRFGAAAADVGSGETRSMESGTLWTVRKSHHSTGALRLDKTVDGDVA